MPSQVGWAFVGWAFVGQGVESRQVTESKDGVSQHLPSGAWESYTTPIDGILNTAAALLSLIQHLDQPDIHDWQIRSRKAQVALEKLLNEWAMHSTDQVGQEILINSLLGLLEDEGVSIKFPPLRGLLAVQDAKLGKIPPSTILPQGRRKSRQWSRRWRCTMCLANGYIRNQLDIRRRRTLFGISERTEPQASLCRMYNDYGSLARHAEERSLNSGKPTEFWHRVGKAEFTSDDAKSELVCVAEYERRGLDIAMTLLEKELGPGDLMSALRMFVDVTDLYGQIYALKDVGPHTL
ncbi:hypothetical protein NHQ30_010684 [Ciborinia camelliae]|nr:hypothetical protein NHQ30_010684 [Ciborinia camelliae]